MPRTRIPIGFGVGVDRSSGVFGATGAVPYSLRNLMPGDRTLELRPGAVSAPYGRLQAVLTCNAIVAVIGRESKRDWFIVTFNSTTRDCRLVQYAIAGDVATITDRGLLWTLGAGATYLPPRIIMAEAKGSIFVAHDEPLIAERQVTKYWDGAALNSLTANLDNTGAKNALFSGVLWYNESLWGWGFGADNDKDRGDILRASRPGDAVTFLAEDLFYVGTKNDPITGVVPVGDILAVRKRSEGYRIDGNSPSNYDIFPADQVGGCEASRLAIALGKRAYCWSHDGPRALLPDGSSASLGLSLDLMAALPDFLQSDSRGAAQIAFAFADPLKNVIHFLFPIPSANVTVGFGLVLADPQQPRWYFEDFQVGIFSGAAVLTPVGENGGGPPAITRYADLLTATDLGITADAEHRIVELQTRLNADELGGADVQVWRRKTGDLAWTVLCEKPYHRSPAFTGASGPKVTVHDAEPLTNYDYAVRALRPGRGSGSALAGYTQDDPNQWSAGTAAQSKYLSLATSAGQPEIKSATWARFSPTQHSITLIMSFADRTCPYVIQRATLSGGPWTDVATLAAGERSYGYVASDAELGTTLFFRALPKRGALTGTASVQISVFVGPIDPLLSAASVIGWRSATVADLVVPCNPDASKLQIDYSDDGVVWTPVYDATPAGGLTFLANKTVTAGGVPRLRTRIQLSAFGVANWSAYTTTFLTAPSGSAAPAPVLSASSFPAAQTARVNFTGGGSFAAGETIRCFYSWRPLGGIADGQRVEGLVVAAGGANVDSLLPEEAAGKAVTLIYFAVGLGGFLALATYGGVVVALGVCPA